MKNILRKDLLINGVIIALALTSLYVATKVWGAEEMRAWIESSGAWAPLAIIVVKISTIVFAPLNGAIIYPIAGGLFGFWKAFGLVLIGDTLGASIAFWISRRFGREKVETFIGGDSGLLSQILTTMGTTRGFFVTRILLFTAQDILAYAAGLTRLPFFTFLAIHMLVGAVPSAILTAFGATLFADGFTKVGYIFLATSSVAAVSALGFIWYASRNTIARG